MPGTIQRGTMLHDQDTGSITGYVNPLTGKASPLAADNIQSLVSGAGNPQIDPRLLFNIRPSARWEIKPPSPYAANTWLDLTQRARDGILAEGKQATWEAMTVAQREGITHPSIVFIPGGWSGYTYWMAFTPYCNADSSFENPCVVASNDGRTWVVPAGLVNPIFQSPAGVEYGSDTHLYFDAQAARMVLLYRTRSDTHNYLRVSTSVDGVAWSPDTVVWTGVIAAGQDMASPSIWFNSALAKWEIVGHNVDGGASWPFLRISSADLLTGWDTAANAQVLNMPAAPGRRWWHSWFGRLASGEIIGVAQDNSGVVGGSGDVYLARSFDGVNFSTYRISGTINNLYRPTLAPISASAIMVLYSRTTDPTFQVFRHDLHAESGQREADRRRLMDALSAPSAGMGFGLMVDSFDRADASAGANPLGTSSGGQAWTNQSATDTMGIVGNAASNITTGNCRAHIDLGRPEYTLLVQIGAEAQTSVDNIILRWQDASNFMRMNAIATPPRLENVIAGAVTVAASANSALPVAGDIVRLDVFRDRIRYYLNGVLYLDHQTTQFTDATRAGIQSSGTVGQRRWAAFAALEI